MFALANVLHFFAHKFPRLGGGRLAFLGVCARPLDRFFFWHNHFTHGDPRLRVWRANDRGLGFDFGRTLPVGVVYCE